MRRNWPNDSLNYSRQRDTDRGFGPASIALIAARTSLAKLSCDDISGIVSTRYRGSIAERVNIMVNPLLSPEENLKAKEDH